MGSRAEAELSLVLKARNLASGAVDEVSDSIRKVGDEGEKTGGRFGKLGQMIDSIPFGRLLRGLLDIVLDSKPVRDMLQHIGAVIGERLAPVMAKLTAWVNDHLIPALTKLADFIGPLLSKAIDGVAWTFNHVIIPVLETVIGVIAQLIGWIKDAIDWLNTLADKVANALKFEKNPKGMRLGPWDLGGSAAGGWVGLNGPEIRMVGERGPEYVVPNHQLGGMRPGYVAVAISEKDIARMVDERLYFTLRRAAPTSGRV